MMQSITVGAWLVITALFGADPQAQQTPAEIRSEALKTLKQAATFYRNKVANHSGYVYYYSFDLTQRWGEGQESLNTIVIQPPGTPTVGMAYLKAYAATDDPFYRDAARETAGALVYGQLESGGWTQVVKFTPAKRFGQYRNGKGGSMNISSLDDNQTQSALTMLMLTDEALKFQDPAIHEAATYGLNALLKAQFPNGAFPQVWTGPVEPHPIVKAKYPDYDWKTEGRVKNYWDYYTLNDGLAGTVCDTLLTAHRIYQEQRYLDAVRKLGDFLILAQMPEPQPAWCQQYNYDMVPIWARKFEPPAVTGWESQDVIETLIKIYRATGDKKYLAPIKPALAYLKTCLLLDHRIPRYLELTTNKPLYMDAKYQLTYDDSAVPAHYGWKQDIHLHHIEQKLADAESLTENVPRTAADIEPRVRHIIHELDDDGRWVSAYGGEYLVGQPKFPKSPFPYISSQVFSRNLEVLSEYLAATRPKAAK
ncbi:MAG: Pectic acid lyase [Planctomycetaceae bacterium]|nr:Pectic acid lyase [Planctomycetaceae bacterium]